MAINFVLTAVCIVRWSHRHYHTAPDTKIGRVIDELTPDQWMHHRFMEWFFMDEM